jgi:hypothetical protein
MIVQPNTIQSTPNSERVEQTSGGWTVSDGVLVWTVAFIVCGQLVRLLVRRFPARKPEPQQNMTPAQFNSWMSRQGPCMHRALDLSNGDVNARVFIRESEGQGHVETVPFFGFDRSGSFLEIASAYPSTTFNGAFNPSATPVSDIHTKNSRLVQFFRDGHQVLEVRTTSKGDGDLKSFWTYVSSKKSGKWRFHSEDYGPRSVTKTHRLDVHHLGSRVFSTKGTTSSHATISAFCGRINNWPDK